ADMVLTRLTPRYSLFPYTTLFRSRGHRIWQPPADLRAGRDRRVDDSCPVAVAKDAPVTVCHVHRVVPGHPSTSRHRRDHRLDRRSEEHTSELQSRFDLVCRLLLEK